MTKMLEVYKCGVCGNITMVVSPSGGTLSCCEQPMVLQIEKTDDAGREKHVPVIEKTAKGIIVRGGSVSHPMEEKHYIQWIEVISGDSLFVKALKPGQKPEAEFSVTSAKVKVRAYCNVHGLWKNKF
jgi:superoxide reductase